MSQLLLKRTNIDIGSRTLQYGELGIANNQLYFGSSSNVPIRLALLTDIPDVSELFNDKINKMPIIRYVSFSPVQNTQTDDYKNIVINGTLTIEVIDGSLQVGDQIQMCNKRLYSGKKQKRSYKMRAYFSHTITAQDLNSKIVTVNFTATLSKILRYASSTNYDTPIAKDKTKPAITRDQDGNVIDNNIAYYALSQAFKYYPTCLRIRREQNKQVRYSNSVQLHPNYVRYIGEYTPPVNTDPANSFDTTPRKYGGWLSFS